MEVNALTAISLFYQNKPLVRNKTIGKVRLYLKQTNKPKQTKKLCQFCLICTLPLAKLDMMPSLKISFRLGAKNVPERFIRIILVFISSHLRFL